MRDRLSSLLQAEVCLYVHSYDTDFMGIVNNLAYLRWFDDMRSAVFDKLFPLKKMLDLHQSLILSETHIRYLHPLTLDSQPVGKTWMSKFGHSSWKIEFEIHDREYLCCCGWQRGCCYSLDKRKPVPFPKKILEHVKNLCNS